MSFAGHVLDMINRQKRNRSLQKQNKQKFAKKKEFFVTKLPGKEFNKEKYSQLSQTEIEANRKRIRLELKKERQVASIKTILTIVIFAMMIFLFWKQ